MGQRALAIIVLMVLVLCAQSCSASHDDDVASSAEAVDGACGVVTATATFTTSGTGSNALTTTPIWLLVPSQVTLASNDIFIPIGTGGSVTATLTFDGTTQCTYSASLPTSGSPFPAPPLPFVSCGTSGLTPGSSIKVTTSAILSGSRPAAEDATFHATATIGVDIDDHNPCTLDTCSGGVVTNDPIALNGKATDDGDPCNGIETCNNGAVQGGTPLQTPITIGCSS